jgi:hypothetical protein
MTNVGSWPERIPVNGGVDFTMMYVAHDAFTRDLHRLRAAGERGEAFAPASRQRWALLKKQLHNHHHVEDTSLWPRLRAVVSAPAGISVLDAMELEHAQIDPAIESVDTAMAGEDAIAFTGHLSALSEGLGAHMRHEENEALPLIDKHLGPAGWAAFGKDIRTTQGGLRGGAEYLPWVLDGASAETTRHVLNLLPPPARVLYRRIWAPRYAARSR